ncbi:arginine repressor [Demequina maris]|uniref:arginine repressor n=1 Tax=Demequina maris TaxID=1638982 RepID=UPI000B0C760F|nr:arginine repressor [Demequina maris]
MSSHAVPQTKAARQALVRHLIETSSVESQTQLAGLLEREGLHATQATLSRDLEEIGAVKVRNSEGRLTYATQAILESMEDTGARLNRLCAELLHSAAGSANLTVLRTPAGAAQFLAMAIDTHEDPDVLGTVAGDDTILVIAADPVGGESLASKFLHRASGL